MDGKTWILVANGSHGYVFENKGPGKHLNLVQTFNHPETRKKGSNLVTDRPGSVVSGSAKHAMAPHTDPKEIEMLHFSIEIAKQLDHGRSSHAFDRLVLVAPPHFLGLIQGALSQLTSQAVTQTSNKNLVQPSPQKTMELVSQEFFTL